MYAFAKEVPKDKTQAFYWFKKAAEQGDPDAQYNLGLMYYYGNGVTTDKKQAKYWIKLASENDVEDAKKVWEELELHKY